MIISKESKDMLSHMMPYYGMVKYDTLHVHVMMGSQGHSFLSYGIKNV